MTVTEDLSVSMNEDTSSLNADDVDLPKGKIMISFKTFFDLNSLK